MFAIKANRVFCVNSLQAEQTELSQAFAGIGSIPMPERFALTDWGTLVTGAPRCRTRATSLSTAKSQMCATSARTVFSLPEYLRRLNRMTANRCSISGGLCDDPRPVTGRTQNPEIAMLRTGEHYLNSLNDGRNVWVGNTKVDNVATHPLTREYARRTAEFFDLHRRPDLQDQLTFVDAAERRSLMWLQHRSKEELVRKRRYHEFIMRHFVAASMPRTPDLQNYMLVTYIDDPEPWEKASIGAEGRGLANNIRNFWQYAMNNDLVVAPHFVDPQADRSDPNAHANSPALRIISTSDEGILVNGVKAIGTASAFGDFLHLVYFFVPAPRATRLSMASARRTSKVSPSCAARALLRLTRSSTRSLRRAMNSMQR